VVVAADRDGTRLVTVVLGHPDTAFGDGALLLDYGYRGFERATVVRIRQPLGLARAGDAAVPAVAGGELSALVSRSDPAPVTTRLRAKAGLSPPVAPGANVGRVDVFVGDRRVGTVPAIAAARPSLGPSGTPTAPVPSGESALPGPEDVLRAVGIVGGMLRGIADAFL
jgi:D-alanyl-D-alanine carboxypeptidase (penicillin-binding protein 5/6)